MNNRTYLTLGTPQYILAKAGLVQVDARSGQVSPTPALGELFLQPPVIANIESSLIDMVRAEASDRSGSLSGSEARLVALGALRREHMKMDDGAAGKLYELIQQGMEEAAREKARPRMR